MPNALVCYADYLGNLLQSRFLQAVDFFVTLLLKARFEFFLRMPLEREAISVHHASSDLNLVARCIY
jgi:hypothetical protein